MTTFLSQRSPWVTPDGKPTVEFFRALQAFWTMAGGGQVSVNDIEVLASLAATKSAPVEPQSKDWMMAQRQGAQSDTRIDVVYILEMMRRLSSDVDALRAIVDVLQKQSVVHRGN